MKITFVFILLTLFCTSCSQLPSTMKDEFFNHRKRGIASLVSSNDCATLLKDVLYSRDPELSINYSLAKLEKGLDSLSYAQGDEFIEALMAIEKNLDEVKEYIITHASEKQANQLIDHYTKLYEWRHSSNFHQGQFGFKKLKALVGQINSNKKIKKQIFSVREEIFTERKIDLVRKNDLTGKSSQEITQEISEMIFLRQVHPKLEASLKVDWKLFKAWVATRDTSIPSHEYRNIGEVFDDFLEQFKSASKEWKKKEKKELLEDAQIKYYESYNELEKIKIKDFASHQDFITKAHLLISSFSELDPIFKSEDFFNYLSKNNILNEDFYNKQVAKQVEQNEFITLGNILNQKYGNFAPYAINARKEVKEVKFPKRVEAKAKEIIGKTKTDLGQCKTAGCYAKTIRKHYLPFTRTEFYKKNFNCLTSNPFIIKSIVMDFTIVTSSLLVYYFSSDTIERFPWELVLNNMVFMPIMGEANCRASFKSPLNFGERLIKEEVFASKALKAKRFAKSLTTLSLKGGLATIGLMGFTYGIDHLYLALGHTVANPTNLVEMAQVLPFMFTYYAIWNNVKGLVVQNPIRHKLIPKIGQIFEAKTHWKGSYIYAQTGLDLAAFYYLSMYHNWEYLTFYQNTLEPWWRRTIGLEDGEDSAESDIQESEEEISVTTEYKNGLKSHAIFEKLDANQIRLKAVDAEIPQEILEQYIENSIIQE